MRRIFLLSLWVMITALTGNIPGGADETGGAGAKWRCLGDVRGISFTVAIIRWVRVF